MPLDANAVGQAQGGIPSWMLGLHKAIDPATAFGGYGNLAAMALPVGRAVPMNFKVSPGAAKGSYAVSHELPSGATAQYGLYKTPEGGLRASVDFEGKSRLGLGGYGRPAPTAQQGVSRLKDVYASIEALVSRLRPTSIEFTAATNRLGRVYDKVAPQIAERLGGKLSRFDSAEKGMPTYEITFPNAQTYPLKK